MVWNINKESATKLANEINEKGLNCILCDSVESAVRDADIIITVTMATKPILRKEWVKEGTHINGNLTLFIYYLERLSKFCYKLLWLTFSLKNNEL